MDYTRTLAEFCRNIALEALPPEVTEKAKLCVLDYVANIYGSLELDAVQRVVSHYRSQGGAEACTVLGCGFRTSVTDAAFINGTTAEAIEAQDGLRFGGNHPCSAVMPAAFALAESRGATGAALLEAIIAGYEMASRVAAAVHPFHTLSGFLPTGTCGTFGAAVAAGKLIGLDAAGMLNAVGDAGYLVPLSMAEELMAGCTVKIVQGGQAASAGITAAGLAEAGITGFERILEGSELNGGFTQITVKAEPVMERLTDGLGERYSISDIYFKPFTACRHTHGAAQATLSLLAKEGFSADDVESVKVNTYAIASVAVGKGVAPGSSFVSAQFSIPYVVAVCLLDGELGPRQLTERRIADPAVLELAGRVTVEMDDGLNAIYPDKTASRVAITLKNGTVLTKQVDIPKGDPRDPMLVEDLIEKVRRFAGSRDVDVDKIAAMVLGLEGLSSLEELIATI